MLESILRRILRRKVEQKVEKEAEKVVSNVVDQAFANAGQTTSAPSVQSAAPAQQAAATGPVTESEWDTRYNHDVNYFRPIIANHFPEYTLEENVTLESLAGIKPKYPLPPYTFVMRKNGVIALVISLQSVDSYKKGLHTACEKGANLKHINFFIEYPDHEDYVVNRIREHLAY